MPQIDVNERLLQSPQQKTPGTSSSPIYHIIPGQIKMLLYEEDILTMLFLPFYIIYTSM